MHGDNGQSDQLLARLRRIEGQVRGLQRMIEDDAYCVDVLTQVAATTKALQGAALRLVDFHLHHCVTDALVEGGTDATEKVDETTRAIERLMRL